LTLGSTALCLCSETVAPKPKRAARGKKVAVVEEAAAPIEKAHARKGKRSYDVGAIMSRREGVAFSSFCADCR